MRCMEKYIDDMPVKSDFMKQHINVQFLYGCAGWLGGYTLVALL